MMLRWILALVALIGLTVVGSAFVPAPIYKEPPKPKVPELYAAMQGTWAMTINNMAFNKGGMVRGGRPIQRSTFIRIQGTTWSYIHSNNGTEYEGVKYEIVLDPTASPATLDLKQEQNLIGGGGVWGGNPAGSQVALKGIIKVEENTLTFCYVSGFNLNAVRPVQFNRAQIQPNGTNSMTMTLKKVK